MGSAGATRSPTRSSGADGSGAAGAAAPTLSAITAAALTSRELAVFRLMSEGRTNREIGTALHISPSTAGVHVSNILHKLGSRRRSEAVARGLQLGLIDSEEE